MKFNPLKMPINMDGIRVFSGSYKSSSNTSVTKCHIVFLRSLSKYIDAYEGSVRNAFRMSNYPTESSRHKQHVSHIKSTYTNILCASMFGTLNIATFLPNRKRTIVALPYSYKELNELYLGVHHIKCNKQALRKLISLFHKNFPKECPRTKGEQLTLAVNTPSMKRYKQEISEKDVCKLIDMVKGLENQVRSLSRKESRNSLSINGIKLTNRAANKRIKALEKSKGHILPHF